MARVLNANVVVANPKTGAPVVFEAGQEVPAWAAGLITNEDLFETAAGVKAPAAARRRSAPKKAEADPAASEEEPPPADGEPVDIPPMDGDGSEAPAWRAYAASKGFEFDADVDRDEIIAALTAENIPTE